MFLLFPARPRDRVRAGVAAVCEALAAHLRDPRGGGARALDAAVKDLRDRYAATPFRPSGPTGATGALAAMVDELDWLKGLVLRPQRRRGAARADARRGRAAASSAPTRCAPPRRSSRGAR